MNPDSWQTIDKLFQAALEREPTDRSTFLDEACGGDAALRREVEAKLASDAQAGSFITPPAIEVAAKIMRQIGRMISKS